MKSNFVSNSKFYLNCTEGLFYKSKINSPGVYVFKTKHGWKVFTKSKKKICTTVTSHVKSSKSNDLNTYNSDNVIGSSNIYLINIYTKRSSNKRVTLKKKLMQSQVLVSMRKIWMKTMQVKKNYLMIIQQE